MKKTTRGKFIVIEGADGSGKTTQVARVHQYLLDQGIDAIMTREPGGTPGAEELRNLVVRGEADRWDGLAEFLIFSAARRDHLVRRIIPTLDAGTWVVCDRFTLSTYAMQVYAGGVSVDLFDSVTRALLKDGGCSPDLTIYLAVDADTSIARTTARETGIRASGDTRMERKGREYLSRVLAGYEEGLTHHQLHYVKYSAQLAGYRYATVDATPDVDTVTKALTDILLAQIENADLYEEALRECLSYVPHYAV